MGRNDYIAHYGRSKADGAAHGSGRYPLGSGKDPYQHGSLSSAKDYKKALNNLDNQRVKYQAKADKANLKVTAANKKANRIFNKAYNSSDYDGTNLGENLDNGKLEKVRAEQRKHETDRDDNQAKADEIQTKINDLVKDATDFGYTVQSKDVTKFANQGNLFIAQVVGGLPASIGYYAATAKYNNQSGSKFSVQKDAAKKEKEAKSDDGFNGDTSIVEELNKTSDLASKEETKVTSESTAKHDKTPTIGNINPAEIRKKDSYGYYDGITRQGSFDGGKTQTYIHMDVTAGIATRDKKGRIQETLASSDQLKDYQNRSNNYMKLLNDPKVNEKLRDKIADRFYDNAWVNDDPNTKITRQEFKKNLSINSIGFNPSNDSVSVYWDDGGSYYGHTFACSTSLDGGPLDLEKGNMSLEG